MSLLRQLASRHPLQFQGTVKVNLHTISTKSPSIAKAECRFIVECTKQDSECPDGIKKNEMKNRNLKLKKEKRKQKKKEKEIKGGWYHFQPLLSWERGLAGIGFGEWVSSYTLSPLHVKPDKDKNQHLLILYTHQNAKIPLYFLHARNILLTHSTQSDVVWWVFFFFF